MCGVVSGCVGNSWCYIRLSMKFMVLCQVESEFMAFFQVGIHDVVCCVRLTEFMVFFHVETHVDTIHIAITPEIL